MNTKVKKPVSVLLDPPDIKELRDYKKKKGQDLSSQIRQFVKEGLEIRKRRESWSNRSQRR